MFIEVFTDGSATTNDKPGGYGWVMVHDDVKHSEGSGHMPLASNNDAELQAAIEGLRAAYQWVMTRSTIPEEGFKVTLVSDSQLILGWASKKYTFRQTDKLDKFKELLFFMEMLQADTRWVEGHTGHIHNERCDELANEARTGASKQTEKAEAILTGKTLIGNKKIGVVCFWYKNCLKIVDLANNIVEDYDRSVHGTRGSFLEVREDKNR